MRYRILEKTKVCRAVTWLLLLSFGLEVLAFPALNYRGSSAMAAGPTRSSSQTQAQTTADPVDFAQAFQAIEASPSDAFPTSLGIDRANPALDQDPFFLRTQSWVAGDGSQSEEPEFSRDRDSLVLKLPGAARHWRLQAPVHPVAMTDQYVVLAANEGGRIFREAFRGLDGPAQGVFLVAYNELLAASVESAHVPVYFLPLPGDGWVEKQGRDVTVEEIAHRDVLLLTNTEGFALPVPLLDIATVIRAETINFTLALGLTFESLFVDLKNTGAPELRNAISELDQALRLVQLAKRDEALPESLRDRLFEANSRFAAAATRHFGEAGIPLARGSTAGFGTLFTGFDLDHPEKPSIFTAQAASAKARGSRFSSLAALTAGAFSGLLPSAKANDGSPWPRLFHRTGIMLAKCAVIFITSVALKHTVYRNRMNDVSKNTAYWNIMAHSLTFMMQAPSVWSSNLLELVLDKAGVVENSWIRKAFNESFGMIRKMNTRTPVNAKTFAYGFGILGVVDSVLVGFQTFFLSPWINQGLAKIFPSMREMVEHAYDPSNSKTLDYNLFNVVGNLISYITAGAYAFSQSKQEVATNDAIREARDELQAKEGINPDDPRHRTKIERRANEIVRSKLKAEGLPDDSQFLFDAGTTYQKIQGAAGFKAPKGEEADQYVGVRRPGRIMSALKMALKRAEAEKADGSELSREAYEILVAHARAARTFGTRREARATLVSLTKGSVHDPLETVPEVWSQRSSGAASRAAQIYREEFFKQVGEFLDSGEQAKADGLSYDPLTTEGPFARWQLKRANRKANERFLKESGVALADLGQNGNGAELTARWQRLFRQELLAKSGLYPDFKDGEFISKVDVATDAGFQQRLKVDPAFAKYLGGLEPSERLRVETTIKADLFARNYVEMSVNQELVPQTSPSQPGRFQRLRQTQLVRNSKVLTGLLRFHEGLFADTRYNRGLWAKIGRDIVPFAEDFVQGNIRMLRRFPIAMTAGYAWSWFIWNTALPPIQHLLVFLMYGTTIAGPWAMTQRIVRMLGWKPARNPWSMVGFAVIGSFATFTGSIFYPLVEPGFNKGMESAGQGIKDGVGSVVDACQSLLTKR